MNACLPNRQRGAALLLGSLFLTAVLSVIALTTMRSASVSVTDSGQLSEAAAALYLAESAIERAAARLAQGIACTDLPEAALPFGAGTLRILSATDTGTTCDIRVAGTVLLSGQVRARRILEASLRLPARGLAFAVGNRINRRGHIVRYDGSRWVAVPDAINGSPDEHLEGLDCVAADDCWAVGRRTRCRRPSGGRRSCGTIVHWDGSNWRFLDSTTVNGTRGEDLFDVDCVAADDCWTVGKDGSIAHWDGTRWTSLGYDPARGRDLHGLDCVATDDCWAVGERQWGHPTILHWNGSQWRILLPWIENRVWNRHLNEVHCIATDDCWAVGDRLTDNRPATIAHWNGSYWEDASDLGIPNNSRDGNHYSVYCVTANDCWAVGRQEDGIPTITHYDGSRWQGLPAGATDLPGVRLFDVACAASDDCWLVGDNTGRVRGTRYDRAVIAHFDGVRWSLLWPPDNASKDTDLNALAILDGGSGGGGGSVAVIDWQEMVF